MYNLSDKLFPFKLKECCCFFPLFRMLSRIRWCPWLGVLLVSMALLKPCSGADCDSGSAAADNNVITCTCLCDCVCV